MSSSLMNQPGCKPSLPFGCRLVVPVTHRDLPARPARAHALEGRHVDIVAMGAPPHFEIERRKQHGVFMRDTEDVQVRDRGDAAMVKHRLRNRRIVIAGQEHNWKFRPRQRGQRRGRAGRSGSRCDSNVSPASSTTSARLGAPRATRWQGRRRRRRRGPAPCSRGRRADRMNGR